ncbi:hypothetical protein R3W88_014599 [Solanum pinnatisectum]|uniref:Alpha-D-phosphohexomutase alpha/beta/alpha domain-containing protein n=1 Tax=Solanum pinnatisectum TaxID=50273 RepID=A0AAV9KS49_9SOLN|nr:hypothetical protein R3W88_014599 [Solanum pinnatisectum]
MASTFSSLQTINSSITNFPCVPIIKKPKLHISLTKTSISSLRVECCSSSANTYNEDEEMDKIRGEKGRSVDLTPPAVEAIAESFGEWVIKGLNNKEKVVVSLGKDPRISGSTLSVAVFSRLTRAGCMVFDMGLATTPACFMSTILPPCQYDASIMVRRRITLIVYFYFMTTMDIAFPLNKIKRRKCIFLYIKWT